MKTKHDESIMDREEQMILNLLSVIEEDPDTTQKDLATRLGVAAGAVNSYLKRVIYKGFVKTKSLQRRRLRYLLTPSGIKEKTRLTYEFLQYSFVYIREIRKKTRDALTPLIKQGKKRLIFFGAGEPAELAYLTVRELGMQLLGIVDDGREGQRCIDYTVRGNEWLEQQEDAEILLILNKPEEAGELPEPLQELIADKKIVCVYCK